MSRACPLLLPRVGSLCVALTVAVLFLAVSPDRGSGAESSSHELTVYSSLPLSGLARHQASAIVRGARLALEEAGGVADGHSVRYLSLNDATSFARRWTPERTAANARRAARDDSTIAYLGEYNSGASAISMPILNVGGIPQISPSNTGIGLTRAALGAEPGEPDKYYPTGRRHYFRIATNDIVQGGALAVAARDRGCRRTASLHDGEVYGAGVGGWLRRYGRQIGLRVVYSKRIPRRGRRRFGRFVRRVRSRRPDCVVFTGVVENGAVRLFRLLGSLIPRAKLFGSDGVAISTFTDPRRGGLPPRIGRRVLVTVGTLVPEALPAAGREFFRRYSRRYRDPIPDLYAPYGYEAMRLVLDAIATVGPDRAAVISWLRSVRGRRSVLGTYSFNRFGDATLRDYGVYRISRGQLIWAGAVRAP